MSALNVHATALVRNGDGLLIRGEAGSGKSLLALLLLDDWALRGMDVALVSDDRVNLIRNGAAIDMSAPSTIAGLAELRGRGIVSRPHRDSVPLTLVIDIVPDLQRMPEDHEFVTNVLGVALARCPVPALRASSYPHQRLLIEEALRATDLAGA